MVKRRPFVVRKPKINMLSKREFKDKGEVVPATLKNVMIICRACGFKFFYEAAKCPSCGGCITDNEKTVKETTTSGWKSEVANEHENGGDFNGRDD